MSTALTVDWPRNDYSRVPFWLYHDEDVYALEMERIFRGPVWNYLALEAELPKPGDFRTVWIGETSVVVSRGQDGKPHAFVNRCAHRGAQVVRRTHGNAAEHVCIYHRWCYSNEGELIGVPFRRGLKGQGGMPADFDPKQHGLKRLRVESFHGVLFGTFATDEASGVSRLESLHDYLGEFGRTMIARFFARPIRIMGYHRQMVHGNWKLYAENLRDTYHASLLHEFFVRYGLDRATQKGGVMMDDRHRHNMNHAYAASDSQEDARAAYADQKGVEVDRLQLRDTAFLKFVPEFADGMNLAAPTIFPNFVLIQISNSLAARQIRPKGKDAFEIFQTMFAYADDSPEMIEHRMLQTNLVGPAGYVSMEDGEAIEIAHRMSATTLKDHTVVEMGGRGEIADTVHRLTEAPIRGFWSYWAELMQVEAVGGVR
jgi:anthranilate 1,2-dioxygenase large subunit